MTVFGRQLPEPVVHPDVHGVPSEQSRRSDQTGIIPPWTRLVSDGVRTFKVSLSSTSFFIAKFSLDNVSRHRLDARTSRACDPECGWSPSTRMAALMSKRGKRVEISSRN